MCRSRTLSEEGRLGLKSLEPSVIANERRGIESQALRKFGAIANRVIQNDGGDTLRAAGYLIDRSTRTRNRYGCLINLSLRVKPGRLLDCSRS